MSKISQTDFSHLDRFASVWGLPTVQQRVEKRLNSTLEDLQEFHDAILPHLESIIAFLNQYPLQGIPERHMPLAHMALAMCEIDDPVIRWRTPILEEAVDPRKFRVKKSFHDAGTPLSTRLNSR